MKAGKSPSIIEELFLTTQKLYDSSNASPENYNLTLEDQPEGNESGSEVASNYKSEQKNEEEEKNNEAINIAENEDQPISSGQSSEQTSSFLTKKNELMKEIFESKAQTNDAIFEFKERISKIKNMRKQTLQKFEPKKEIEVANSNESNGQEAVQEYEITPQKKIHENTGTSQSYQESETNENSGYDFAARQIVVEDKESEDTSSLIIKNSFPNSIRTIQEVDESAFTTEGNAKISPNWGKHRSKLKPGEESKIPFMLDEEPTHRIGSGSKKNKTFNLSEQEIISEVKEESSETINQNDHDNQSLQTELQIDIQSHEFPVEQKLEFQFQNTQTEWDEGKEIVTQTEQREVQEIVTQTEQKDVSEIVTQTEQREVSEIVTQTEQREVSEIVTQTENNKMKETQIQTETNKVSEKDIQTKVQEFSEIKIQTEERKEKQLEVETQEMDIQTDKSPVKEWKMQTERNKLGHMETQTEKNTVGHIDIQTERNEVEEMEVQTEKKLISCQKMQTENHASEQNLQTEYLGESIQVQASAKNQEMCMQTLPMDFFEEEKIFYDQEIQAEDEKAEFESISVQAEEPKVQSEEISIQAVEEKVKIENASIQVGKEVIQEDA